MLWVKFEKALREKFGDHRFVTIFVENTIYSHSTVSYWQRSRKVPPDAFTALDKINIEQIDTCRFKGYHRASFYERVVELSNINLPVAEIAAILSRDFNKKVTENAVKSARYRNKDRINNYRSIKKSN